MAETAAPGVADVPAAGLRRTESVDVDVDIDVDNGGCAALRWCKGDESFPGTTAALSPGAARARAPLARGESCRLVLRKPGTSGWLVTARRTFRTAAALTALAALRGMHRTADPCAASVPLHPDKACSSELAAASELASVRLLHRHHRGRRTYCFYAPPRGIGCSDKRRKRTIACDVWRYHSDTTTEWKESNVAPL